MFRIIYGQADDPYLGMILLDSPGGLDAVEFGHVHIHNHHIRRERPGMREGLLAIAGLSHHLDSDIAIKNAPQPLSDHGMVVHQENTDGASCRDMTTGRCRVCPGRQNAPRRRL